MSNQISPNDADQDITVAIIACGALSTHIHDILRRKKYDAHVIALPPILHNSPHKISPEIRKTLKQIQKRYENIYLAYADCGTYGAIDEICDEFGISRMSGNHCYDIFYTQKNLEKKLQEHPGTYILTDFLLKSFEKNVIQELGLDNHPELRDDYFKHYTKMLWMAQDYTEQLHQKATKAAMILQLPLEVINISDIHLEEQLDKLFEKDKNMINSNFDNTTTSNF